MFKILIRLVSKSLRVDQRTLRKFPTKRTFGQLKQYPSISKILCDKDVSSTNKRNTLTCTNPAFRRITYIHLRLHQKGKNGMCGMGLSNLRFRLHRWHPHSIRACECKSGVHVPLTNSYCQ